MVVVIDTGLGNVASIVNMLRLLKCEAVTSNDPDLVYSADRIILPGVGSFDAGMRNMRSYGLDEAIRNTVRTRDVPLLGVCLGMQLLVDSSEEGELAGLGVIPGRVVKIPTIDNMGCRHKLPHMGWNSIEVIRTSELFAECNTERRFYFVHSYHVVPRDPLLITSTARLGNTILTASIQSGKVFGAQFHPEKSHRFGIELFKNFLKV